MSELQMKVLVLPQSTHEFHSHVASRPAFSQPNHNLRGISVDETHACNLMRFLSVIGLIDAESVDPKNPLLALKS